MIDIEISWERLETYSNSKEISFESFNFQIAYSLFSKYGDFEYDYNTPGSEFYLTLKKDCPDLDATTGQVVGWQVKSWLNKSDQNNTSFNQRNRTELINGFKKSKKYKSGLVTWIICTPGQPLNTRPHLPKDTLKKELRDIDPNITIKFWNKPIYEALRIKNYNEFTPIFFHYFGDIFIGFDLCQRRTQTTLKNLKEKFDVELYVPGKGDEDVWQAVDLDKAMKKIKNAIEELDWPLKQLSESDSPNIPEEIRRDQKHTKALIELKYLLIALCEKLKSTQNNNFDHEHCIQVISILHYHYGQVKEAHQKARSLTSDQRERWGIEWHEIREVIGKIEKVYDWADVVFQQEIHLLGDAGQGKTCLACHIATSCLDQGIPAILLTGRLLSENIPINRLIVDRLDLQTSWTLNQVLGCLNNLGFLKRKKVPIIIDGLNETVPNCSRWKEELNELRSLVEKFPYVLLITTSRMAYTERIFGKVDIYDIDNAVMLDGFSEYNVEIAVKRYFDKYRINATIWSCSRNIFVHPLLLKIFCTVNENCSLEITQASVFSAIEEYVEKLVKKIAQTDGEVNKFHKKDILDCIEIFAKKMWQEKCRSINYFDLPSILDPDWNHMSGWQNTNTCKLLDEGLLLSREIREGEEVAEFSYDMVAGVVIAKSVFFSEEDSPSPLDKINSKKTKELLNGDSEDTLHPLAEDILRALIYLWPRKMKEEQLFEVFPNKRCLEYSFEMLDVLCSSDVGIEAVQHCVLSHERSTEELYKFCLGEIDSVIHHACLTPVEVLLELLIQLSMSDIELSWTRAIAERKNKINEWLKDFDFDKIPGHSLPRLLIFLSLLCSSKDRVIRDQATKRLILIGRNYPDELLYTLFQVVNIDDIYILERVVGAVCGIILNKISIDKTTHITKRLKEEFVPKLSTTNVNILDCLDTIFAYSGKLGAQEYDPTWTDIIALQKWETDSDCDNECDENHVYMGYGPIHHDFARNLEELTYDADYRKINSLHEITSKIIWFIKSQGFDSELFQRIDTDNIKKKKKEKRYIPEYEYSESYCKKMSFKAFHELCGHMLLDGVLTSEHSRFRFLDMDIDLSLPSKPGKKQVFTSCCVAKHSEILEDWVAKEPSTPYFKDIMTWEADGHTWILLYGDLRQSGREESSLSVNLRTQFCNKEEIVKKQKMINNDRCYVELREYRKLMAGEIPWRTSGDLSNNVDKSEIPVGLFYGSSTDSTLDSVGTVSFLTGGIINDFKLEFDPKTMNYVDHDGKKATVLCWDNTSEFLFVRKDLVKSYCNNHQFQILWIENSYKFRIPKRKKGLGCLRKDFMHSGVSEI